MAGSDDGPDYTSHIFIDINQSFYQMNVFITFDVILSITFCVVDVFLETGVRCALRAVLPGIVVGGDRLM